MTPARLCLCLDSMILSRAFADAYAATPLPHVGLGIRVVSVWYIFAQSFNMLSHMLPECVVFFDYVLALLCVKQAMSGQSDSEEFLTTRQMLLVYQAVM